MRPAIVKIPTAATLKKYGGTVEKWEALGESQGWVCAVCGVLPPSGRLVIDHSHERGFKKLPPDEKWKRVRGLLCWVDNYWTLHRTASVSRLTSGASYLASYEKRKPK